MKRCVPLALSALLVAAVLLTGCTAGASAKVTASATKVTLALAGGNPAEVAKTSDAHIGDVLKTNSGGRAQLDYPDGSLTRLGPDTKVTVKGLDSAAAQRTSVKVDVGQTWHRVKKLVAENSQYEVSTPVGVASVKGTAFEVDCTNTGKAACTTTVIEGIVKFTTNDGTVFTLTPYQRLVVPNPDGGNPVATVAPADAMKADKWISANITKDKIGDDVPAEAASLAGDWKVDSKFTSTSGLTAAVVGGTRSFAWTFSKAVCDSACKFTITSSGGVKYASIFTKSGFTAIAEAGPTSCPYDPPGAQGPYKTHNDVVVVRNADTPTGFSGQLVIHYVHNDQYVDAGKCKYEPRDFDEKEDVVLTRK